MLRGKRVFISGGAGVIGKALVERLLAAGAQIWVGDLKPRPAGWSKEIHYRQGDLNSLTEQEAAEIAPHYFFHLAATFERSTETYEFWEENDRHNVRLSHHLLELMRGTSNLKKIIFASSYLIYNPDLYQFPQPADRATVLKETDPIYPPNLCGMAKLLHEKELQFISDFSEGRLKSVSARIYRVYGKDSRDIVSRWIQSLIRGETIQVYRKEGMFDYIYAGDVAEGLYRLALSDTEGVVNLGNGRARRVEEVLRLLKDHFPNMHSVEGDSDIPYEASEADMSRFRAQTGWSPERNLEDVIPELIEHYRSKQSVHEQSLKLKGSILISSVSRKISLIRSVKKAANKLGGDAEVIGGDRRDDCLGKRFADGFWHMPRLDGLELPDLLQECQERGIAYIIPSRDGELAYYAGHKHELIRNGIHVMVSDLESVNICLDKLAFYKACSELGFPVIRTTREISELEGDCFVVKERFGAGSRSIGIRLNRESAVEHARQLNEPIFQPYVNGKEISVDVYVSSKGSCKGVVLRSRDQILNGESQITTTFRDEKLERLFASIAEKLHLYGHAVFQALITEDGDCRIIECNSRWGGASRLSLEAGLDSFYWFLLEANGADLEEYPFLRSNADKQLIRYPEDRIQEW